MLEKQKPDRKTVLKELFRKTIHLCSAFVPLFLKYFYWITIIALLVITAGYCVCEYLRYKGHHIFLISKITETAARKRDENKFVLGPVTLVFGIILAALMLPLKYASAGIWALSFGDGLASLVGKLFGRVEIPHTGGKTVAGSLACFTAVFVVVILVSKNVPVALLSGLAAMIIEVFPMGDFDNLVIPVTIGSWFWLLCHLFGI